MAKEKITYHHGLTILLEMAKKRLSEIFGIAIKKIVMYGDEKKMEVYFE